MDNITQSSHDDNLFAIAKEYNRQNQEEKALPLLKDLVSRNHAGAQAMLALYYEVGVAGLSQDKDTAFEYYTLSAEQGCSDGFIGLGYLYDSMSDYEQAFQKFEEAGKKSVDALVAIGNYYKLGKFVAQDYDKAEQYFTNAIEIAGVDEMWFALQAKGFLLWDMERYKEAIESFTESLALNDSDNSIVYLMMGQAYSLGRGVEAADYDKAFEYFLKAYEQGSQEALWWIGQAYEIGEGVDKDVHKAAEFYQKSIDELEDSLSLHSLADLYGNREFEENPEKACSLLARAFEKGDWKALEDMSYYYQDGWGLDNREEEIRILKKLLDCPEPDILERTKIRLEELGVKF